MMLTKDVSDFRICRIRVVPRKSLDLSSLHDRRGERFFSVS